VKKEEVKKYEKIKQKLRIFNQTKIIGSIPNALQTLMFDASCAVTR
jgi:hypothetical protein